MSWRFGTVLFISGMFVMNCATLPGIEYLLTRDMLAARPQCWFLPHLKFAHAWKTQLSNFKFNTWNRSATHNEQPTVEGHSPETSEHLLRFWHFHQHSSLLFIFKHSLLKYLQFPTCNYHFTSGIVQRQYLALSGLRLNFSALKYHLFQDNRCLSPACPLCDAHIEDRKHYFLYCPSFAAQRKKLYLRCTITRK